MRIVSYIHGHSGPTYHRISVPLNLMRDTDVCVTNNPTADYGFAKGCDLFMWNRWLPDKLLDILPDLKEQYGFSTCCDLDDYWELDPHHILYGEYLADGHAERQIRNIRAADVVLVTNSRLAEKVRPFNPNVEVVENAIPRSGQFDVKRSWSDLVRLFWQGSVTHEADIAILERPIDQLKGISKKIKMIMGGFMEDQAEWQTMAGIYTANFKHQYKIIPGAGVLEYYASYQQADICLIPLVRSRFNGMKSNLKVLEAANMGIPVIASAVDPYLDMPINYCRTGRDWVGHVKRLVQFPARRKEDGQWLAEFCREHYNFDKINQKRKEIFEYAIAHR